VSGVEPQTLATAATTGTTFTIWYDTITLDQFRAWLRGYLEAAELKSEQREAILRELARVATPPAPMPVIPMQPTQPFVPQPWQPPYDIWCTANCNDPNFNCTVAPVLGDCVKVVTLVPGSAS
jgi:hypothetical protein